MSTAMTHMDQDTRTLYVAFELGEKEWKLAMSPGLETRPQLRSLRARATTRLLEVLEKARQRFGAEQIVSCYEAGRDGFWLDRFLRAHGIDSRIVDSASIEVRRRARRVKTDRLDAQKLLTMLTARPSARRTSGESCTCRPWPTRTPARSNASTGHL